MICFEPGTNDATRLHPRAPLKVNAATNECRKVFQTESHSIIIESWVNKQVGRKFFLFEFQSKFNSLYAPAHNSSQLANLLLQLSLHKIFLHYPTTIHITKINFLLYSLSNTEKLFYVLRFLILNANFSIFAEWKITQFIVIVVFTEKLDFWCIMTEWKVAWV